jgi:hypothetical protein
MILLVPSALATPTVIRVGGPSDPADSKVAIVASDRNLRGARFELTKGDVLILRGRLTPAKGAPDPWAHAYRADISGVEEPGAYRVRVAGKVSRPWEVRAGGSESLVPLLLRFFEGNRDGNEPSPLHGPSHLNDAVVKGGPHDGERVDMVGGWMDAGDMIHFTQTTAFSTALLEAAARLDPVNRAAIQAEALVGVRWLLRAHPFSDVYVTQVAGLVDHHGFRDPVDDDASPKPGVGTREAFHFETGVGGDIGGKVAAALALSADHASEPQRSILIAVAADWYAAGKASDRSSPELPKTGGFYHARTFKDSLAAGAAALYRVTGKDAYLQDALEYLRDTGPTVIDFGNFAPVAAADICGRLGAPPLGPPDAQEEACGFLTELGADAGSYADKNPFGPASYFEWGTTAISSGSGAFAAMAGGPARAVGAGARDYLFGRNAWGASFVTGVGPLAPRRVHHWAAALGGNPPGAIVGGPAPLRALKEEHFKPGGPLRKFNSARVMYEDKRANYVTSEPTIDGSAAAILLLAAL